MTTAGVVGSERPGLKSGRSRPGDRGEGRSAGLRCMSGETCRPRCIAAPSGAGGRGGASPLQRGGTSPVRRVSARAGATGPVL
ncbi:O-methyltransferase [Thermomicrobium roseum DSM 5159]|uniref:O-methyltransferase n=1 Tax=Thermomicrobium roseum (strain ATCC 27502 / DSM 5159 / P-2) TaxID=309801 RepID=B9L098_THERP|nr:O-methyltransferase [Thermomicrobium roseum DSM 5159]